MIILNIHYKIGALNSTVVNLCLFGVTIPIVFFFFHLSVRKITVKSRVCMKRKLNSPSYDYICVDNDNNNRLAELLSYKQLNFSPGITL